MRQLKVLHLIEGLGSGGAERLLFTNLKHFEPGAAVNLIVTVFTGEDFWAAGLKGLGAEIRTLNCRSRKGFVAGVWRLIKLIREFEPDIIHTHLWTANVIGRIAGRITGVPVVSSIHNPDYEPESVNDGSGVGQLQRKVLRGLDRWSARFGCSRMIAVSSYVRQGASEHLRFPLEKIDVIYNPIDIDVFAGVSETRKNELLASIGVPANSLLLLNVGRVAPQKGLLYAVQALERIASRFPNTHLISVGTTGDAEWCSRIRDEAARIGLTDSVHLLGDRSDVADLLSICDVFVFPSLHEGLGIALIEAMATGCACVASDIGPIREFIDDGKNGLLVPPKQPVELASRVIELLEHPEQRQLLGEAARETVLRKFQPSPAAARLGSVYLEVADAEYRI
jgi:glycosyltransferase involved in cell wall biosynthesis